MHSHQLLYPKALYHEVSSWAVRLTAGSWSRPILFRDLGGGKGNGVRTRSTELNPYPNLRIAQNFRGSRPNIGTTA